MGFLTFLAPPSLDVIREGYGFLVKEWEYDDDYGIRGPRYTFIGEVMVAYALWLWFIPKLILCKVKGHKLHVDTVAGPESGTDYMECERCGWTHHHIYY